MEVAAVFANLHAKAAQNVQCQIDVGTGLQWRGQCDVQIFVQKRRRQEQASQVLAGDVSRQFHCAAVERTTDRQRQVIVCRRCAKLLQHLEDFCNGTLWQSAAANEIGARAEGCAHWQKEAQRRAAFLAIDRGGAPGFCDRGDADAFAFTDDFRAQGLHTGEGGVDIDGACRKLPAGRAVRQTGGDEKTVGRRF